MDLKGVKENQKNPKAPIFTYCKVNSKALEALANRMELGHKKYFEYDQDYQNFTRVENGEFEYTNAMFRHALGIGDDEDELQHKVATAWNAVSDLEIYLRKYDKS